MDKLNKFVKYKHEYIQKVASGFHDCKILEVGSGSGEYTQYFCKDNSVTGLDIFDYRKKDFLSSFEFIKYDGKIFPFPDNTFDIVTSWDVIEHVQKDKLFAQEMKRVLKHGGTCICGTPNKFRFANFLRIILLRPTKYPFVIEKNTPVGDVIHIREYTEKGLMNLFKEAGFPEVSMDRFGFGLRGNLNLFFKSSPIKGLANYVICNARKNSK